MQQASSYFMTHYINIKTHLPGAGLQFLLPLIQDAESSETFRSAFEAVSMASIASRPNSGAIVPLARVYYNKALRQIALTVQDKSKAKEDQALASIIMMIIYEVTIPNPVVDATATDSCFFFSSGTDVGRREK